MRHVQLDDELYLDAERRAQNKGFKSVDGFVADCVAAGLLDEMPSFDDEFTSEVLQALHCASANVRAGKGLTDAQLDDSLNQTRSEWRSKTNR